MATGIIAICSFLSYIYEPTSVSFKIPTTSTFVNIRFGDVFDEAGDIVLAVNEFFDHSLGNVVSPNSVHGAFITRIFNSDENRFRQAVDDALSQVASETTTRAIQPSNKYPIGTTAVIPIGSRNAFLVALTNTHITTSKASTSVEKMWHALAMVWQSVHDFGNGHPLSLPLIGNGRSSLNLEPQHLLRLIVLSMVDFARKVGLPPSVTIVVPDGCFEELDIREIARDWRR